MLKADEELRVLKSLKKTKLAPIADTQQMQYELNLLEYNESHSHVTVKRGITVHHKPAAANKSS